MSANACACASDVKPTAPVAPPRLPVSMCRSGGVVGRMRGRGWGERCRRWGSGSGGVGEWEWGERGGRGGC